MSKLHGFSGGSRIATRRVALRHPVISDTSQPVPPLIDDPNNRIYRGLDPSVLPMLPGSTPPQPLQDRIETVRFPNPGKFLVICDVLPHFFDVPTGQFIMFGYVRVEEIDGGRSADDTPCPPSVFVKVLATSPKSRTVSPLRHKDTEICATTEAPESLRSRTHAADSTRRLGGEAGRTSDSVSRSLRGLSGQVRFAGLDHRKRAGLERFQPRFERQPRLLERRIVGVRGHLDRLADRDRHV